MPDPRAPKWLETLPVALAGTAALLYFPSLGLSSTFGFVGLALAVYALYRGARKWTVALAISLNAPFVAIGALILFGG